jgi:Domain of unknown function (DUF4149)
VNPSLLRASNSVALLAAAVWLGGLVALGAIAAPAVFAIAPFPASADAMTVVFRRFDLVAMACGALVVFTEAIRVAAKAPAGRHDVARAAVGVAAAVAAVLEGEWISPRIAALHASGVTRRDGLGATDLAQLHNMAEICGQTEVLLLAAFVVLHVVTMSSASRASPSAGDGAEARVDARSAQT